MAFKMVFISIFLGTALIVAALVLNRARPGVQSGGFGRGRGPQFVRATGKCAVPDDRHFEIVVIPQEENTARARSEAHAVSIVTPPTELGCDPPNPDLGSLREAPNLRCEKSFEIGRVLSGDNSCATDV